jgi:excisionase family DNA binding protein
MPSIRTYIQQKIREVESWLELPPDETDWEQVALDCRTVLGEVEQQATLSGVPEAVKACQVRGACTPVTVARRILAECLAACPPDREKVDPVLLTVKQAAARYNMGERTLYRLLEQGDLPNRGHGTSKRIKPADLERYLEGPAQPKAVPESLFD